MVSREFSTWQRGILPLLLLQEIQPGPVHGYALGKALAERGFEPLKGATLYPALARLEEAGCVWSRWQEGEGGPGRKVYVITKKGEQQLAQLEEDWQSFTHRVASVKVL